MGKRRVTPLSATLADKKSVISQKTTACPEGQAVFIIWKVNNYNHGLLCNTVIVANVTPLAQ